MNATRKYIHLEGTRKTLYDLVIKHKPETIVEFGTHVGFAAISMATALRDLNNKGLMSGGQIYSYDYLDDADERETKNRYENIKDLCLELEVYDYITFGVKEFYSWVTDPTEMFDFDMLHVDIGSTHETLYLLRDTFHDKINDGTTITFEGGSEARDKFVQEAGKNSFWEQNKDVSAITQIQDDVKYKVLAEFKDRIGGDNSVVSMLEKSKDKPELPDRFKDRKELRKKHEWNTKSVDQTLYNTVINSVPKNSWPPTTKSRTIKIVEFTTDPGNSTVAMALAIKDLIDKKVIAGGKVHTYDIFEGTPHELAKRYSELGAKAGQAGVGNLIEFGVQDFYDWIESPERACSGTCHGEELKKFLKNEFDILHIDIGSTHTILRLIRQVLDTNIQQGAMVLFEGGSGTRDNLVQKATSGYWLDNKGRSKLEDVKEEVGYRVLQDGFPSVSMMKR